MLKNISVTSIGRLILQKGDPQAGDDKYLEINVSSDPPSLVLREGNPIDHSANKWYIPSSVDQTTSAPEEDVPISKRKDAPIDFLIACTESDFKFFFNGKFVKSVSYWHDITDGTFPTIRKINWAAHNRITKLSWTFGK